MASRSSRPGARQGGLSVGLFLGWACSLIILISGMPGENFANQDPGMGIKRTVAL